MGKIRDMASTDQKATRKKKLKSYGLNSYLTEGVTMQFLAELDKLATSVYYRYGVKDDLDYWLDVSRDKVLDLLPEYDATKGPLVPFIFSALRNKATNVSRRREKLTTDEALVGMEGLRYVTDDIPMYSLLKIAESRGITFDPDAVLADMREGIWTPMTAVAAWMHLKGVLA